MSDARHDLPEDAPALFEAALAGLPPQTAVVPEVRGRHPHLRRAALSALLGPDACFDRAVRQVRRDAAAAARIPGDLARPWRTSALLGLARADAHGCVLLLSLAATPLGLVGWTNTGATPSSIRLRARPGVRGAVGPPPAVAALRRLLAGDPPAVLRLPAPASAHDRLADRAIFGPEGRAAVGAGERALFVRRQHGMAALALLDGHWNPRILALATDG